MWESVYFSTFLRFARPRMGAGARIWQRGEGCGGCTECDAAIAQIEADGDAAERRAAEAPRALVFEREGRDAAVTRLWAATDRLEIVEPMCAAVRPCCWTERADPTPRVRRPVGRLRAGEVPPAAPHP